MNREKLEKMLLEGEGYTVEFKECVHSLNDSVFETVCSFSNRYGGVILLGVKEVDGRGVVIGVDPNAVDGMKKNFVNQLNNPQKINPSLYLTLEEFDYDGKIVLWVQVPISSQIEFCTRRIYDRNHDADQDVSTSADLVANIASRKSATYLERKIFPYATTDDLCMDMLPRIRQMALNKYPLHAWKELSDLDLLKSAGLYARDMTTGEEGFNMAAILLLGKPETIRSCVPAYKTDAIYRVENLDRYDDRLIVEENLLKSYDRLIAFIEKHTNDKFFLVGDQNVSVRTVIAREIVSNILVHRDFGSAYPARIIIERDRIITENWSKAQRTGRLNPEDFTPLSKNPLLANFFVNIGYADSLGSGVRKLYRFSKIYSGQDPIIEEGDMFRVTIPLVENIPVNENSNVEKFTISDKSSPEKFTINDKSSPEECDDALKSSQRIVSIIKDNASVTATELAETLNISLRAVRKQLAKLKQQNILRHVGPNKGGHWEIVE